MPKAELAVDLGLVGGVGVAKGGGDVAELCLGPGAFGLGLGDPPGDYR
ncbi:hypothetical protein [Micromonospora sp. NPDC003776]